MSEITVKIDRVPPGCRVMFSPFTTVYAENMDTGATGPLLDLGDSLLWADLDPTGAVGGE